MESYEPGIASWKGKNRRRRAGIIIILLVGAVFLALYCFVWQVIGHDVPLYDAAMNHDWPAVQRMLEQGADPNETTDMQNNRTALMEACRQGRADMIRLLVSKGADPDIVDTHGDTPRDFASGNPDIVALVKQGGTKKQAGGK